MQARSILNSRVVLAELKACKSLEKGKRIHAEAVKNGNIASIYVANSLVNMYGKCESMVDAHRTFNDIKQPNIVSWTALMLGYARSGDGVTALDLFAKMKSQGFEPNRLTYVAAIKACTCLALRDGRKSECLERGRRIHTEVGCNMDIFVYCTLIDMYSKCGSMVDARRVFECIEQPNVVAWNVLILGYAENGESATALEIYYRMRSRGVEPNSVTFIAAFKACSSLSLFGLERGKEMHLEIRCELDISVQNTLIDMYSKCGSMVDAHKVFDNMKSVDVVSWNVLIMGYAERGEAAVALKLFARMKSQGFSPHAITFVAALKACTYLAVEQDDFGKAECLEIGKQIHSEAGSSHNPFVQSALIDMYANCRSMAKAHQVFNTIKSPDVVSWTALIMGYVENGQCLASLDLFKRMKSGGCEPDCITYVVAIRACTILGALERGRKIHSEISRHDGTLLNGLVDFYVKCGSLEEGRNIFDSHPGTRDLRTWNALLAGYGRLGNVAVFGLFEEMLSANFQPDGVTILCLLACCSHVGLVEKATQYCDAMSTKYGIPPTIEHYNCMLDILGRSNKLGDAIALLRTMPCRASVVTWMAVLGASRKCKNEDIGRLAFKSVVSLDDRNTSAYVLLAHIYESRGMLEEQRLVLGMKDNFVTRKESGETCWTNERGEVYLFNTSTG